MKEKRVKSDDGGKKHRKHKKRKYSSSSSSTESDEWVEKKTVEKRREEFRRHSSSESSDSSDGSEMKSKNVPDREDWMSMTGMIRTYTKEEVKPPKEIEKKQIDSYNPATSARELNPYWKDGGAGLPQTSDQLRKSKPFLKPKNAENEDYYKKTYYTESYNRPDRSNTKQFKKPNTESGYCRTSERNNSKDFDTNKDYNNKLHTKEDKPINNCYRNKSYNWRRGSDITKHSDLDAARREEEREDKFLNNPSMQQSTKPPEKSNTEDGKYLSDEKMNKLAAKIVKAEIMGDMKLVNDLKVKLEAARQFRKENPGLVRNVEEEGVMLIATSSTGNSRPLTKSTDNSKGKKKIETHQSGERMKYFGNDDKYTLSQMFEEEKYGNNYDDEAQVAKIISKHKNPNDDLEDIFTSEISKNIDSAKEDEKNRQRAIKSHNKIEKSLEGCEFCVDSKKMLKHLMISCGSKVYLALPSRKSLVKGHSLITTIQHSTCVTSLDEDVWEEIMNYRGILTQYYNSLDMDVVFFETATKLDRYPHMVINCIPLPRDIGDAAPIYFKKALLECEAEWAMNKKLVDLTGKNIRKGIPKGLPYFWIDFGMDPGFAHVIEDQHLFPRNFAEEIIGGILDLDHNLWKNPQKEYGDLQRKKVLEFLQSWKPFDTLNKR